MEALAQTDHLSERVSVYAGFWSRVLAKLVDGLLVSLCFVPLDLALRTSFVIEGEGRTQTSAETLVLFASLCLYSAFMESSRWQATFGKRALGILVTDVESRRISLGRSLLRAVTQFTGIGYFLMLCTTRRQALHDLIAATLVVPGTL